MGRGRYQGRYLFLEVGNWDVNHRTNESNHSHGSICDAFSSYFLGARGSAVFGERAWRHLEVFGGHNEDKLPHAVGNGTAS